MLIKCYFILCGNSGDVDAVVSVTSTRYSISAMNLTVIKPWHVWHDDTKEVSSFYLFNLFLITMVFSFHAPRRIL